MAQPKSKVCKEYLTENFGETKCILENLANIETWPSYIAKDHGAIYLRLFVFRVCFVKERKCLLRVD